MALKVAPYGVGAVVLGAGAPPRTPRSQLGSTEIYIVFAVTLKKEAGLKNYSSQEERERHGSSSSTYIVRSRLPPMRRVRMGEVGGRGCRGDQAGPAQQGVGS